MSKKELLARLKARMRSTDRSTKNGRKASQALAAEEMMEQLGQ